jgi:hypothetical protein
VQDVHTVQCLQALDHLNEDPPNFLLSKVGLLLLVPLDFLEKIPVVSILHHDAERLRRLINECFVVGDDRLVIDAG